MKPHFTWSRALAGLTFSGLLLSLNGCSFLYNLNTNQCNSDTDCQKFGTTCSIEEHVCKAVAVSGGGSAGLDGSGGASASSGADAHGGSKPNGGASANGGSAAEGGEAGSGACSTNADCIAQALDQPAICRIKSTGNECVVLTSDQCPILLPTSVSGTSTLELLKTNSPVILGGFASMLNAGDPHDTLAVINWDMAFQEFNEGAAKNSNKSAFQPMLGVICNGLFPKAGDFQAAISHLTEEIGTPGILSTLSSTNLLAAWDYTQAESYNGDSVMFLSTSSATLQLANLDDSGYVWHLLGDPRLLAATVAGIVQHMEPYVTAKQPDTAAPLKLALVFNENQTLSDIATVLTNAPPVDQAEDDPHRFDYLSINGDLAIHQSANFYQVQIESDNLPANQSPVRTSAQKAGEAILLNPPQFIIGLAGNEFVELIKEVESNWGKSETPSAGLPRPYYVLSQYLATSHDALTAPLATYGTSTTVPTLDKRLVGVNYALAQDTHSKNLYDSYLNRLKRFYGSGALTLDGTENYYDGAYSMLYASSVTNRKAPIGADVRDALENRVLNPDGTGIDIGPTPVETEVPRLISNSKAKVSLWGTDGPPNFDRVSGTRLSPTSAWCMTDAGNFVYKFAPDGLLYDANAGTFSAPGGGAPDCLSKFKP
ncbi:MAG TPA: hypothetical protein VER04_11640 [Polyangiaceae bacterium]|nr:hypothetical protein [Polyangiaceae bacterium]